MLENCQKWRQTVEGVGLDALYDEIDPFDVSPSFLSRSDCSVQLFSTAFKYPEREIVFKYWPLWFHKAGHSRVLLDAPVFTFCFTDR